MAKINKKKLYQIAAASGIVAIPTATTLGIVYGTQEEKVRMYAKTAETYGEKFFDEFVADSSSSIVPQRLITPFRPHAQGGTLTELTRLERDFDTDAAHKIIKRDKNGAESFALKRVKVRTQDILTKDQLESAFKDANKELYQFVHSPLMQGRNLAIHIGQDMRNREIVASIYEIKSLEGQDLADAKGILDDLGTDPFGPFKNDSTGAYDATGTINPNGFMQILSSQGVIYGKLKYYLNLKDSTSSTTPSIWSNPEYINSVKQGAGISYSGHLIGDDSVSLADEKAFDDKYGYTSKTVDQWNENRGDLYKVASLVSDDTGSHGLHEGLRKKNIVAFYEPSIDWIRKELVITYNIYKMDKNSTFYFGQADSIKNPVAVYKKVVRKSLSMFGSVQTLSKTNTSAGAVPTSGQKTEHDEFKDILKDFFTRQIVRYLANPIVKPGLGLLGKLIPSAAAAFGDLMSLGQILSHDTGTPNVPVTDLGHPMNPNYVPMNGKGNQSWHDYIYQGIFDDENGKNDGTKLLESIIDKLEKDPAVDVKGVMKTMKEFQYHAFGDGNSDNSNYPKDYWTNQEHLSQTYTYNGGQYHLYQMASAFNSISKLLYKAIEDKYPGRDLIIKNEDLVGDLMRLLKTRGVVPADYSITNLLSDPTGELFRILVGMGQKGVVLPIDMAKKILPLVPFAGISNNIDGWANALSYLTQPGNINAVLKLLGPDLRTQESTFKGLLNANTRWEAIDSIVSRRVVDEKSIMVLMKTIKMTGILPASLNMLLGDTPKAAQTYVELFANGGAKSLFNFIKTVFSDGLIKMSHGSQVNDIPLAEGRDVLMSLADATKVSDWITNLPTVARELLINELFPPTVSGGTKTYVNVSDIPGKLHDATTGKITYKYFLEAYKKSNAFTFNKMWTDLLSSGADSDTQYLDFKTRNLDEIKKLLEVPTTQLPGETDSEFELRIWNAKSLKNKMMGGIINGWIKEILPANFRNGASGTNQVKWYEPVRQIMIGQMFGVLEYNGSTDFKNNDDVHRVLNSPEYTMDINALYVQYNTWLKNKLGASSAEYAEFEKKIKRGKSLVAKILEVFMPSLHATPAMDDAKVIEYLSKLTNAVENMPSVQFADNLNTLFGVHGSNVAPAITTLSEADWRTWLPSLKIERLSRIWYSENDRRQLITWITGLDPEIKPLVATAMGTTYTTDAALATLIKDDNFTYETIDKISELFDLDKMKKDSTPSAPAGSVDGVAIPTLKLTEGYTTTGTPKDFYYFLKGDETIPSSYSSTNTPWKDVLISWLKTLNHSEVIKYQNAFYGSITDSQISIVSPDGHLSEQEQKNIGYNNAIRGITKLVNDDRFNLSSLMRVFSQLPPLNSLTILSNELIEKIAEVIKIDNISGLEGLISGAGNSIVGIINTLFNKPITDDSLYSLEGQVTSKYQNNAYINAMLQTFLDSIPALRKYISDKQTFVNGIGFMINIFRGGIQPTFNKYASALPINAILNRFILKTLFPSGFVKGKPGEEGAISVEAMGNLAGGLLGGFATKEEMISAVKGIMPSVEDSVPFISTSVANILKNIYDNGQLSLGVATGFVHDDELLSRAGKALQTLLKKGMMNMTTVEIADVLNALKDVALKANEIKSQFSVLGSLISGEKIDFIFNIFENIAKGLTPTTVSNISEALYSVMHEAFDKIPSDKINAIIDFINSLGLLKSNVPHLGHLIHALFAPGGLGDENDGINALDIKNLMSVLGMSDSTSEIIIKAFFGEDFKADFMSSTNTWISNIKNNIPSEVALLKGSRALPENIQSFANLTSLLNQAIAQLEVKLDPNNPAPIADMYKQYDIVEQAKVNLLAYNALVRARNAEATALIANIGRIAAQTLPTEVAQAGLTPDQVALLEGRTYTALKAVWDKISTDNPDLTIKTYDQLIDIKNQYIRALKNINDYNSDVTSLKNNQPIETSTQKLAKLIREITKTDSSSTTAIINLEQMKVLVNTYGVRVFQDTALAIWSSLASKNGFLTTGDFSGDSTKKEVTNKMFSSTWMKDDRKIKVDLSTLKILATGVVLN